MKVNKVKKEIIPKDIHKLATELAVLINDIDHKASKKILKNKA